MIALPTSATLIAAHVRPATRSPIQAQPSRPAMNGLRLWMISTLATAVRASAMMKQVDPMGEQTATPGPAGPHRGEDARGAGALPERSYHREEARAENPAPEHGRPRIGVHQARH